MSRRPDVYDFCGAGVAAGLALVAAQFGFAADFGAHPIWASTVAHVGAAVGAVVAPVLALMRFGWPAKALAMAFLAVLAGVAAWQGKARFAESYAEDALAGRMWFLGWIALISALVVLVAILATRLLRKHDRV